MDDKFDKDKIGGFIEIKLIHFLNRSRVEKMNQDILKKAFIFGLVSLLVIYSISNSLIAGDSESYESQLDKGAIITVRGDRIRISLP